MPNLSYGRLDNVRAHLDGLPAGALQVREQLKGGAPVATATAQSAGAAPADEAPAPVRRAAPQRAAVREEAAPASVKANDDKW